MTWVVVPSRLNDGNMSGKLGSVDSIQSILTGVLVRGFQDGNGIEAIRTSVNSQASTTWALIPCSINS
jgi:predicted thioredoxin/glutaredoxin